MTQSLVVGCNSSSESCQLPGQVIGVFCQSRWCLVYTKGVLWHLRQDISEMTRFAGICWIQETSLGDSLSRLFSGDPRPITGSLWADGRKFECEEECLCFKYTEVMVRWWWWFLCVNNSWTLWKAARHFFFCLMTNSELLMEPATKRVTWSPADLPHSHGFPSCENHKTEIKNIVLQSDSSS